MLEEFFKLGEALAVREQARLLKQSGLMQHLRAPAIGAALGASAGLGASYGLDQTDPEELLRNTGIGALAGGGVGAAGRAISIFRRNQAARAISAKADAFLKEIREFEQGLSAQA